MVDSYNQEKIKELYKKGCYEQIALFVEPDFRIGDIIKEYDDLSEAEKIITCISYNIYRKDNPIILKYWNYKQVVDLKKEMFLLAELDKGLQELFSSNNDYFMEHIDNYIDVDFLKGCNENSILYLYNIGYKDLIIENVLNYRINFSSLIEPLLSIEEFRNKVITKKFLLHGFNSRYDNYFFNLPDDRKGLLGLYGADIFRNENYSVETYEKYKRNLEVLFVNNFPSFDKLLINKLINMYGKVSYDTLCFVLDSIIINDKFLDEMYVVADKYFNRRLWVLLSFYCKYPHLSSKIFSLDVININIIKKIYDLSVGDILEGVDSLSVEEFLRSDIEDFTYSFFKNDNMNDYNSISPVNLRNEISLYNYYRGIAKIDSIGNWEEHLIKGTHDDTLKSMYPSDKAVMELLYEVNINGDVIFAIENAGLIVWLPPILTKVQMNKILEKINSLKDKKGVDIFLSIANPNEENNYIYLNNGMPLNIEMAIDSIKRIRVRDKIKIKK